MRRVHGVHHRVRHPTARDGLYLHPLELLLGLGLLLVCAASLGPMSPAALATIIGLHLAVNIIARAGVEVPLRGFGAFNNWAARHDRHHGRRDVDYAIMLPFWDSAFGTDCRARRYVSASEDR